MDQNRNITEEIWDRRGTNYEKSITKWPDTMYNNVKILLPKLNPSKNDTVLEFAAGSGFFTIPMAKTNLCKRIIAVDVSKRMRG